jgi:hypothetical protein
VNKWVKKQEAELERETKRSGSRSDDMKPLFFPTLKTGFEWVYLPKENDRNSPADKPRPWHMMYRVLMQQFRSS